MVARVNADEISMSQLASAVGRLPDTPPERQDKARREALESADWARANGLWHEALVQQMLADDLIPQHLRWAFYDEE